MSTSFVKGVTIPTENFDGSLLRIAIIHTRWNYEIVENLVRGAKETMISHYNVKPENIIVQSVSGSFELPFAAKSIIQSSTLLHAVICIGVLIKGSTMHFEYISEAVSQGIMRVGLDTGVPVIFGVLTCLNDEQALERAGLGDTQEKHNHGIDWGHCAVEMAHKTINWRNCIFK